MIRKSDRLKCLCIFFMMVLIIFLGWSGAYAGSKKLGAAGETGYSLVKDVEQNYITTEDGKFSIPSDTKIYDQNGMEIKMSDIHKNFLADIRFVRIKEELTAIEINVKSQTDKGTLLR